MLLGRQICRMSSYFSSFNFVMVFMDVWPSVLSWCNNTLFFAICSLFFLISLFKWYNNAAKNSSVTFFLFEIFNEYYAACILKNTRFHWFILFGGFCPVQLLQWLSIWLRSVVMDSCFILFYESAQNFIWIMLKYHQIAL